MALLEYSEDFELDDDGILRDSTSPGGGYLDDDGILRDDYDFHDSGKFASTHWTDSGFGGSKQSAGSTSTLRQFDLQSYPSYDSVSHPLDDERENISDLEASKDDLSFDQDGYTGYDETGQDRVQTPTNDKYNDKSVRSSHSSYNNSLSYDEADHLRRSTDSGKELFDEEYYKQLRELGVLVDGADLVDDKDSLREFEHLEQHVSKDEIQFDEREDGPAFDDYLRATPTPQEDDSVVPDLSRSQYQGHDYQTSQTTRPTTATSLRTLSRGSFPEISPEEALELYKENLESRDFEDAASIDLESSQRTNDDDEIFLITSKISENPKPSKIRAYQNDQGVPSMSPSHGSHVNQGERSFDRSFDRAEQEIRRRGHSKHAQQQSYIEDSFDDTDYGDSRGFTPDGREGSVTPDRRAPKRSSSATPTRPDSVASQRSTASDRAKTPTNQGPPKNLPKPQRNQSDKGSKGKEQSSEKMPKRLLPKPTPSEENANKNFRVKSKSTTNLASKFGPMKPAYTNMSLVDLSHINIDQPETDHTEDLSASSDKAKVELSSKLKQEFHKRKQATELVQQLQMDYDKLLSKYALAELTIDQLRLGAKITLHSDSPTPSQATSGSLPGAQQQQILQLGPGRAVKSPSPFQGSICSPLSQDSIGAEFQNERFHDQRYKGRSQSDSGLLNGHPLELRTTPSNGAEGVKIGLLVQARSLDERMESFKTLMEEGQLTHEEQEKVFDKIRTNHEKLRHDYLQSKEDYNVLKRSTPNLADINFDGDKELEGELFRLGMKFDEIHEAVEQSEKEKASQRQPFQKKTTETEMSDHSDQEGRSVDQMKQKMKGTKAGDDLIEPRKNSEFEQKVKRLHEEYNALMDRYRRLKQMAQTPERDKEIDNLVRKLRGICDDEPDIFKMPKELQDSLPGSSRSSSRNQLHSNSSRPSSSQSGSANWFNDELDSSSPEEIDVDDGWEQLHDRDEEARLLGRRRPSEAITENGPVQNGGVRRKEPYASVENQSFIRGREDDHDLNDSMDVNRSRTHQEMNGDLTRESGLPGSMNISGSRGSLSSLDSRGRSPRDFDQSHDSPHLPRPRRHDLRDPRRLERKKHNMSASLQSLGDSGISDQENGATGGPLSNIPGPGKFKEMTKQRNAHDADSGFIGSVVGSEVSQLSSRQQQQQQQQQPTLRLREPPASPGPSSRQRDSDSSMTSARVRNDRPPSRDSIRNRRDKSGQTRDYTDDSYTLTTESEMSFEIPTEPRGGRKNRGGSVENTIEEEDEGSSVSFTTLDESRDSHQPYLNMGRQSRNKKERPRSRTSQHSRASSRSNKYESPQKSKAKTSKATKVTDDDVTPKATPNQSFSNSFNQSFNRTSDLYSSEEETPRPTLNRSSQKLKPMKAFPIEGQRPSSRTKGERPATPGSRGERTPTPQSVRSGTPSKRRDGQRTEIVRPEGKREVKDMAVGSDSDDTIEESVADTAATRGSTGSDRLKLLQDEIGRLRDEFQKATNQQRLALQQQLQQVQPVPQPNNQNQDQYFDPTDDPLAFMRGPRRRANSFSGGRPREWDDWLQYPMQQNADGEIPLGYAAADSYAHRPPPPEVLPEPPRSRQRNRTRRRHRHGVSTETQTMNGYDSDQSPTRATASTVTEDHLLDYYIPRYYSTGTQPRAPSMQRYASQPNLAFTAPPPPAPPVTNQVPTNSYSTPISAGYRTRRQQRHQPQANTSPYQRLYSFDDLDTGEPAQGQGQPVGYMIYEPQGSQVPGPAPRPAPPQYSIRTETCPLCGGESYHTHGDYVYDVPVEAPPRAYVIQGPPRGKPPRPRRRSKSASSRVRHYSPDGRRRAKYIVKEFYTESSSAESDDDVVITRGRNRGRRRRGRKYRKSRSVSGIRARSDYEDELNYSLNLTEEIDELTTKMMDTVDGELRRYRHKKDFGSSVW